MWYVEIRFVSGPTFSTRVKAPVKESAESQALLDARIMGFTSKVKKIVTRVEHEHQEA